MWRWGTPKKTGLGSLVAMNGGSTLASDVVACAGRHLLLANWDEIRPASNQVPAGLCLFDLLQLRDLMIDHAQLQLKRLDFLLCLEDPVTRALGKLPKTIASTRRI